MNGYRSASEAPPVASAGEPKSPSRKRRTNSPRKFWTSAVGTHRTTKMMKVMRYGGLRPMTGHSLSGDQSIGPNAYLVYAVSCFSLSSLPVYGGLSPPKDEQGKTKVCCFGRYPKNLRHWLFRGDVYRRAHIHTSRVYADLECDKSLLDCRPVLRVLGITRAVVLNKFDNPISSWALSGDRARQDFLSRCRSFVRV